MIYFFFSIKIDDMKQNIKNKEEKIHDVKLW